MTATFGDLRERSQRANDGCSRCAASDRKTGNVRVMLNEYVGKGRSRAVANRSISFCEPCAVEVYEKVHDLLMAEAQQ